MKLHPMLTIMKRIVAAALVGIAGTLCLFAVNVAVMGTSPDHFRDVVEDAVASGTLARVQHLPLGPPRQFYPHGGEDCTLLSALTTPGESRLRASVSPRIPDVDQMPETFRAQGLPGYPPTPPCRVLAWAMQTYKDAGATPEQVPARYNHRYLHGALTVAAMLLTVLSFDTVARLLLWSCCGTLAALGLGALARMRAKAADERRRAAAFLGIASVLAVCYGLPFYARSFPFAPTDIVIFAFLLFGLLQPLCRLPEHRFVQAVATFGIAIGSLELLTGGIPMALAIVIALVALGEPPDAPTAMRRFILGTLCFGAAIAAGFAAKLVVVATIWGSAEIASFMSILGNRMVAPISDRVPPALAAWLATRGIETSVFDDSMLARLVLAAVMVTYSAFILAYGSHVLGAALIALPLPVLMFATWRALRGVRRADWLLQPQPGLLAAGLVPWAWYAVFTGHTVTHSLFMVRPLALGVALAIVAAMLLRRQRDAARTLRNSAT